MSSRQAALIRIVVVGAGQLGSTFAYALLLSGMSSEIVLVTRLPARSWSSGT